MPDMIPVGDKIIPPNPQQGISSISGMLGLRQQQQQLQTGQQVLQQEQLKTAQQQGVQNFFQTWDPSEHVGSDGTTDLDSALQSSAFKNSGNAKPAVMGALLDIKNKQLTAKQSLSSLNSALVTQLGTAAGAYAKDDDVMADKTDAQGVNPGRAKVGALLDNFAQQSPDAARVVAIYKPMLQHVPQGKLTNALQALQLQAQSASEQQGQQNPVPGIINTGSNLIPTVTNRATGIPQATGQVIPTQLPPGVIIVTDANGRSYRYNTQTGQIEGQVGAPTPGRTQGQGGFTQPVPQQQAIQQSIEDTRKADADYGLNRHVNDQILRLSKNTATGPGTEIWHHALGAVMAPFGGDNVADYQKIDAYLSRQAALSAKQMGLPDTNAGLATAASLSGTTGYQPDALQTKVKLTDALVEGAHQYRTGLDKVVGTGPNQDLSKYQAYRGAWAANFDPNVFRVENALKRGDKAELDEIRKEVGPAGMKTLAQKSANLRQLENGVIPQ